MGWDSSESWKTKSAVVAEIKSDLSSQYDLLGFKSTKTGVWAVVSPRVATGEMASPFILVFLIEKQNGRFYSKDMTESCYPYYYDCPLSFLALATPTSAAWREKVAEYWNDKKIARESK